MRTATREVDPNFLEHVRREALGALVDLRDRVKDLEGHCDDEGRVTRIGACVDGAVRDIDAFD